MCQPPKKLLVCGVSTPYTLHSVVWFVPSSELSYFLIFTHLSELELISAGFQWTGSTPAGFQETLCAEDCNYFWLPLDLRSPVTHLKTHFKVFHITWNITYCIWSAVLGTEFALYAHIHTPFSFCVTIPFLTTQRKITHAF